MQECFSGDLGDVVRIKERAKAAREGGGELISEAEMGECDGITASAGCGGEAGHGWWRVVGDG